VIADGRRELVRAGSVVLAAGTVHSPAVLLRSGIGPAADLHALGVEVVADLPGVGRGLQDHAAVTVLVERPDGEAPARPTNCCVRFGSGSGEPNDLFLNALDTVARRGGTRLGAVVLALFRPSSRGRITLRATDTPPEVDFSFLSDPSDMTRMTAGVRALRDLLDHDAVRDLGTPVDPPPASDDRIATWLLRRCHEAWHLTGTCRMGAPDDPRTVVDPRCRVLGVEGLRVVDASVVPDVPRANTALVTMATAHHALRQ
jgi:5-(hydroxymethyl)furfural/furfural oxidase